MSHALLHNAHVHHGRGLYISVAVVQDDWDCCRLVVSVLDWQWLGLQASGLQAATACLGSCRQLMFVDSVGSFFEAVDHT